MTLPIRQFGIAVTAALAFAASASAQGAAKPASTGKPAASVTTAREASTGMATGRREAQTGQASGAQSNKAAAQPATSADAAKPSGDKKDVGFPACDGASKDAAKCVTAPPAPAAQAAKHVNKVEAISIKQ